MPGNTNIDWQRLQDLERAVAALTQRVSAIDNQPTPPTNPDNGPAQPTNLAVSGITSTAATITWLQSGTVTKTEIFRRLKGGAFTSTPLFSVTGQQASVSDMLAETEYEYGIVAVSGALKSAMSIIGFKTLAAPVNPNPDPGGPREVTVSPARIAAAIAAANAAINGSKDAAYNAALVSGLSVAVIADRGQTPVVRHVETGVSFSTNADGITVLQSSSFSTSVATTLASLKDLWVEFQHPSDPTDNICVPAGAASDSTAKYIIDRDWGTNIRIMRAASGYLLTLPKPAFDTQGGGGGGGGSPGTVDFLISEMVLPFDRPLQTPVIFGAGDGSSGVIQSITLTEAGTPGWDSTQYTPGTIFNNLLPWLVIYPGVNNYNDGSFLIEIWDCKADIFYLSEGVWRSMNGTAFGGQTYPVNDTQFALYTAGNGGAGVPVVNPVPRRVVTPGRYAYETRSGAEPTRIFAFHNGFGGGETVPANKLLDVKCAKTEFKARLVPSGVGNFNWQASFLQGQAGLDFYENPWQGHVASGQMSRFKRITDQEQTFAMTWFRPNAAMHIDAPRNPSLAPPSQYPAPESWLRANPPPGYVNA